MTINVPAKKHNSLFAAKVVSLNHVYIFVLSNNSSLACFSGRLPVSSIADSCFCISYIWRRLKSFVLHTLGRFSCRAYAFGQAFSWRDPLWAN